MPRRASSSARVAALGGGIGVERGSQVSEEHPDQMLGLCVNPLDATVVGHASSLKQVSVTERIE